MTVFAVVEVIMIILGIVLAAHFEEQKELREIKESAEVLFKDVLLDLEMDIVAAERIANKTVRDNLTCDALMNPAATQEDFERIGLRMQYLLGYYANFNVHNKAYTGLKEIHEKLPEEWHAAYKELELFMDQAINIDIYNKRFQKTIYDIFDSHTLNFPWYVRDNYLNQTSPDFIEWIQSDLCKAQTMLVLNDIGNLNYETMAYRFDAIELHELIKTTIGVQSDEPLHQHVLHPDPEMLAGYAGTYTWEDGATIPEEKETELTIEVSGEHLLIKYLGGDSLLLNNCAKHVYQGNNGRADLFYFNDNELRLVKFGIEKDWIYRRQS